jgi:hypothetical protein
MFSSQGNAHHWSFSILKSNGIRYETKKVGRAWADMIVNKMALRSVL